MKIAGEANRAMYLLRLIHEHFVLLLQPYLFIINHSINRTRRLSPRYRSVSQPGPKPFVFGAVSSTSTSSSPEKQQTFFDCLEEQEQDQRHGTPSGSPAPARVTAKDRHREAEGRPLSSDPARTCNNPFATTVEKFDRIGNVLESFNIVGPSTGSRNAPLSLFGNPHRSDSETATKPSEKYEKPGGTFGLFGVPRPSTPPLSKSPSYGSCNGALIPSGHPPPAQTSISLSSASATFNKHEHEGAVSGQRKIRRLQARSRRDPPSIFDLPPPQSRIDTLSLFGGLNTSYRGQTPSAPSQGTSLFGAPSARASGGLFGACSPQASGGLFGSTPHTPASGGLFGASAPQASGGLFGASVPQASSGLFGTTIPAQTSGGLFGTYRPAQASGGLFGASTPTQTSGNIFAASVPTQPSGSLFGASTPAQASGGLFDSSTPAQASGVQLGASATAQASSGLFGTTTPAQTSGGLFGASVPARASRADEAGAPPKLSGQNLQIKADDAWTQQQSNIQLALSSIQDAQAHGQEAHNSFREERDQWQDQIEHLEKKLGAKQAQIVSMSEQIEKTNEQANEQVLKMRRYFSGSGRPPSGTFNQDEWFFDCAANRNFGAMYACLRQMFSGEIHPEEFLEAIKPEDVWYDPFNLCLRREVLLKDGHIYLKKSEGPSVAPDAGIALAGTQVEKNQIQITDNLKPNVQTETRCSDNKDKSDTKNVPSEPAASGNGSKAKPAKDTMGRIIKGRHGGIMSLGPSASQIEEIPSPAKLSELSQTESTKAGPPPTDENNNQIKPTHIRSRSDSTPVLIRGKRSSSARPIGKDENDSAKQTSTPAIRPLIKEEWLTNEQRVSRIRKEEDETVERAMLRKRQQKGQ